MKRQPTITEALKRAIKQSGQSLYVICNATGLNASALGRFVSGRRSLRLDKADILAAHLDVRIVIGKSKGR